MRGVCLLSAVLLFTIAPSLSCPDGFYRMPVVNCPTTRCYRFQEQAEVFQQNRQEKQAFCSGQAANIYDGTGGLIQFRSIEEFNRVKLILGVTQPSAPYLTSLRYSSTGTLEYATGSSESVGSTISSNMPLTTSNSSLFGMCVGIGLVGSSINLMVVNCDKPQIFICDLQLTSVPVPTLAGDNIRYVGPDLSLTLSCQFAVSNAIRGVIWLRNGQDITTQFTAGYSITPNPTSVSDLVFTAFDRSDFVGSYQCMVVGQLGSLRSKRVLVRSAVAPQIRHGPMDTAFPPGSIGFFSCFPETSSLPHPSVVWSKDGTVMDISDGTKFRANARTGRLFISDVAASDAGVYSCQLTNIEATVTSQGASLTLNNTVDLTPLYRLTPDFDIGSDPIRVLEGTQLEMDVVAGSSHPNANYLWSYPSGIAPPGGVAPRSSITLGYRNRPGTTVQASYFGNLILNSAMVDNSGLFSVLVSLIALPITGGEENADTNGEASVIVQSVPTASFPTTAEIVSLGASHQLNCTVDSNPTPTVEWFRNGILLQNDADYELSGSNLTIRSVQTRDLTSFQCLAGNDVGSAVDELYLCGENGVPGLVEINVEPFTTTSVRIRWDPPTNPNDAIELLSYEVYYEQRGINGPRMFDVMGLAPQDTRTWNQREVLVEQLDINNAVVAVVVAVSPKGRGEVPTGDQAAVGFTFGQVATTAPTKVVVTRVDGQRVNVSWDRVVSPRMVDHDITFYQIEYSLCSVESVSEPVTMDTSSNSPSFALGIPADSSSERRVMARVLAVTQVRTDPDAFEYGPQSEVAIEGGGPCPAVIPPLPIVAIIIGIIVPLVVILLIVFVVVLLCLAWRDRRHRGQYFPGKAEKKSPDLDKELDKENNDLQGWEGSAKPLDNRYYDEDDL